DAGSQEVTIHQTRAFGSSVAESRHEFDDPVAILPLQQLRLPEGDYEIAVRANGTGIRGSKARSGHLLRLSLRSADTPSLEVGPGSIRAGSLSAPPAAGLSARHLDGYGPLVRGPSVIRSDGTDIALQAAVIREPSWRKARLERRSDRRAEATTIVV